jgi:hypothetical protein
MLVESQYRVHEVIVGAAPLNFIFKADSAVNRPGRAVIGASL